MKNLLFGLIATVLFAFNGNAQSLRSKFLEGKTYDKVIEDFNELSDIQKAGLWVEKMDQLLKEDLPKEHKLLIFNLKDMLQKNGYSSKNQVFVNSAVKLAEITPLEDFIKMIESLYDYVYKGKFIDNTKVSDIIIKDIMGMNNIETKTLGRVKCSCRWCVGIDHTYSNCEKTEHGCGFLWMQSCNQSITGW